MRSGVKRQMTVVTVDSDIVDVLLKMPYITNVEHAVSYVYDTCT